MAHRAGQYRMNYVGANDDELGLPNERNHDEPCLTFHYVQRSNEIGNE